MLWVLFRVFLSSAVWRYLLQPFSLLHDHSAILLWNEVIYRRWLYSGFFVRAWLPAHPRSLEECIWPVGCNQNGSVPYSLIVWKLNFGIWMWNGCFKTAHRTPKRKDIIVGFLHCLECLRFSGTLGQTSIVAKYIMRIVHSGVFRKRWQMLTYLTNQLLFCSSYRETDVLRASNIDSFCDCCGTSWWPTAKTSRVLIPKMRSPTADQLLSCIRFRTILQ